MALPPSVLIVDDEPDNFHVIEFLLYQEGYDLSFARSSTEALDYLSVKSPDVILLDMMMPQFDGIALCHQIKKNPLWCHLPIIMVTVLTAKEDLALCLDAGADDFISKPVNGIELRARIRSMLRMKQQYDELQALLQAREDLSNMIIHDLNNPLAGVLFSCELLKLSPLQPKQLQKVEDILRLSKRMVSLVNSLLIIAKVQTDEFVLEYEQVDLSEMGHTVVTDFEAIVAYRQIKLLYEFPEAGRQIFVDPVILHRVIDNLLSNAIKFSPVGSQVTFRISYPPDAMVKIQVIDCGSGISEESRQRIFEKYDIGTFRKGIPQIGLGLAFCKLAVEAHGGTISIENNAPQGSIFTVVI
ncbi:Adaptive-response sensory-kinase SasA [Planktothrix tepida]|uniref:histidine kinase n=2 Tax=Planktothrix TaxID=54304 RepID=A0A1J1LQR5_9CYAN|nr:MULTISPECIES: hybrid sensor histidine kinase/response regulator [Planktothrix]CAD5946781.1 Adaptive-response sensory-kinase SasA [Planktothrix pseudagardhii]CAD5963905.1 Adaptive-response sensory-kinase SasA [Planktothrix tepida]CUR34917.1 Histidine kinase [Planktothrix tepida PCC 9214]